MGAAAGTALFGDMFSTKLDLVIFVAYIALFVNQGLLVTASRHGTATYPYSTSTAVLVAEAVKLAFSVLHYVKRHGTKRFLAEIIANRRLALYYMIPASLYCLYNNLAFTNLAMFDPTTYFIFLQTRLFLTAIVYQFLMSRKLSGKQWFAILVVTVGCMIQKMDVGDHHPQGAKEKDETSAGESSNFDGLLKTMSMSSGILFMLIQVTCSVFAGVYTEYILKRVAGDGTDVMLQNFYMYADSIACNLLFVSVRAAAEGEATSAWDPASLLQSLVVLIVANNAAIGIVTSLFLKHLNSILKAIASAAELVFTAVMSYLVLGIPIYWNTFVAVAFVSAAVVIYAQNPIKNKPKADDSSKKNPC